MPAVLQNSADPQFTGEFCHKVEGRNRITIPSDWRFDKEVQLFMIAKSLKSCISVMMRPEVDRLEEKADALPADERSDFLDMLGSSLKRVTMDNGGRISIPDEFHNQLGFPKHKEVWLTGSIKTFNIWSIPDFETFKAQDKLRKEELKRKLGI
jgi:division/cell wall cluster transcriptional repressor MraZ